MADNDTHRNVERSAGRSGLPDAVTGPMSFDRRDALKAVGGTALAVALAGCTGMLDDDDDDVDDDVGDDADIPDEPIQAGCQLFMEGPAALLGIPERNAAQVAVDRINEAGGVAGRQMEIEFVEEGGEPIENYERFVEDGKDVTFGIVSSGNHLAVAPVIEDRGVVNVAFDGTTTEVFEEVNPDPTFAFRMQNYDVQECVAAAFKTVEELGADNIDSVAGVNQNYAFGHDEQELFVAALSKLTDVPEDDLVAYEGWPDLGAEDMSTHVAEVNSAEPDVLFTSAWGGDASLLMEQGIGGGMFDNIDAFVGTVAYSAGDAFTPDMVDATQGKALFGNRNHHILRSPPHERWDPGRQLLEEFWEIEELVPSFGIGSAYPAIVAWATAVEKAVDLLGRWPEQEEIALMLKGHGFFTPVGYHTIRPGDNQGMSPAHFGRLTWSDEFDMPDLEELTTFKPTETAPPPGVHSRDWIDSW